MTLIEKVSFECFLQFMNLHVALIKRKQTLQYNTLTN